MGWGWCGRMIKLARFFPTRYQAFVIDHTFTVLAGFVALVAAVAWFALFEVMPHTHDGYERFPVVHIADSSDETSGYHLRVVFKTGDRSLRSVTFKSIAAAMEVVDTICIERRLREDGTLRYTRAASKNCP